MKILFIIFIFLGCGPILSKKDPVDKRTGHRKTVFISPSKIPRIKSFSNADLTGIHVIPVDPKSYIWQMGVLYAVGDFPDESQGRIPSGVIFTSSNTDVLKIDSKTGVYIGLKPGEVEISAKTEKFEEKVKVNILDIVNENEKNLFSFGDPVSLDVFTDNPTSLNVFWKTGGTMVNGYLLAYKELSKEDPILPKDCKTGNIVTLYDPEKEEVKLTAKLESLKPETEYGIRVCSLQRYEINDKEVSRTSAGVTLKTKTPAEK